MANSSMSVRENYRFSHDNGKKNIVQLQFKNNLIPQIENMF